MYLLLEITWNHAIDGKHIVEDIVTILKLTEEKVTLHSEYLGEEPITVPIKNFWKGVKFIEVIAA